MRIRRKPILVNAAVVLYSWSIRLFSSRTRSRHGSEMRSDFARLAYAAFRRGGHRDLGRVLAVALADCVVTALRERGTTGGLSGRVTDEVTLFFRALIRRPALPLLTALVLALGTAFALATWTVLAEVVLKPLPVANSSRLVFVDGIALSRGVSRSALSLEELDEFRSRMTSFDAVASFTTFANVTVADSTPATEAASFVSPEYLLIHRATPFLGSIAELLADTPADAVALSHGYWLRRFDGDSSVVGSSITVGGIPLEIAAVMPPGFHDVGGSWRVNEMWIPSHLARQLLNGGVYSARTIRQYRGVALLRDSVPLAAARSEADRVARAIAAALPAARRDRGFLLTPIRQATIASVKTPAVVLASGGLILLVLCALSGAALSELKAMSRSGEYAVRMALGASRGMLLRQSFIEALLVAGTGVSIGWLGAGWMLSVAAARFSLPVPTYSMLHVGTVPWWCPAAAVALYTAALASRTAPMIRRSVPVIGGMRCGDLRGSVPRRDLIVATHAAFATVLVLGAGLALRSLDRLAGVDFGFVTDDLLTVTVDLEGGALGGGTAVAANRRDFARELVRSLPGEAGIVSAGIWAPNPPGYAAWHLVVQRADREGSDRCCRADKHVVTPGAIESLGVPLLRGRRFLPGDSVGMPQVAIIDARLAERLWPGDDPIGAQIVIDRNAATPWTVVGVVAPVRSGGRFRRADLYEGGIYLPLYQHSQPRAAIVVRTDGRGSTAFRSVRDGLDRMAPGVAVSSAALMSQRLRAEEGTNRLTATLLGFFASVAALIAMLAVYLVTAYALKRSARELALKTALGASRVTIGLAMLRIGVGPTLAGVCVGIVAVAAVSQQIRAMLYGVSPLDPLVFAVGGVTILLFALGAAAFPVRAATALQPMAVLREE